MPTGVKNKFGDTAIRKVKQNRDRTGDRRPKVVKVRFIKTATGWRRNSRFVWECENNREVPAGLRIYHKDFDTLNDDPANLVAMTCGQWMRYCVENGRGPKEENRKKGIAKFNSAVAAVKRQVGFVEKAWYWVDDGSREIDNRPYRRRRSLLRSREIEAPRNGQIKGLLPQNVCIMRGSELEDDDQRKHYRKVGNQPVNKS